MLPPERCYRTRGVSQLHCRLSRYNGPLSLETGSATTVSAIDVRLDDVGSILHFRLGFPFDNLHWLVN